MNQGAVEHTTPVVPAAPGAEPVPGYRLVRRLGVGGFGEVWSAVGPGGFLVALKIIRLEATRSTAQLRGLEIARAVRHPNLLAGFGAWIDDDRLILALELADGSLWDRFLAAWDAGLGGIPRDELVEALVEAARGVDYLNEPRHAVGDRSGLGIQHRDLKPQNILLVGGGVKVADFGAARWMEEAVTGHTGLQWTPAYAAPEFFLGATSRHSDQYSLAVTYCHLRTGRLPFTGDPAYVMAGHLMREPDLSMLAGAERPVVARALAKRPEDRWPCCRAFAEALRSCASAAPARGTSPGPVAKVCLVWPEHLPGSLAEAAPALTYASAAPPPPDDPDDSLWDDSAYAPPDPADESTADLRPAVTPTTHGLAADDPEESASSVRRRREAVAVAAFLVMGILALGSSGLVRSPTPAPRPPRAPHPVALAALDVPIPRPRTPSGADGGPVRGPGIAPAAGRVARRIALRPVPPSPAGTDLARATRQPDPIRPLTRGLGRGLARWLVPLIVNPTLATARGAPDAPARADERPAKPDRPPEAIRRTIEVEMTPPSHGIGPSPAEAARRRGEEQGRRGELGAAIASHTEAIRLDPTLAGAFAGRGQILVRRGEIARAIADLDEALRLRPDSAPALNDRGLAELARGDVLRGVADLDAALRAAPDSAVIHYNRGVAYSRLGEPDVAIAEFDAALRLDPNLAVARTARSRAPVRQVALTRGTSRSSRAVPAPPMPTADGITPTPQDPLGSGQPPAPPAPTSVPR